MTKLKSFFFAASALTLVIITACSNAAQMPDAGTGGSAALPEAPFVEGGASLILSPNKLDITVKAVTSDGTPVTVEGCTETELTSGTETVLHAQGTVVILKGKITALKVDDYYSSNSNKLTALNVQGLTALERLVCGGNQLTELNVQGLTALKELSCGSNQLTELNVQGLTALQGLNCAYSQLTALNVQGLTALQELNCYSNQLTALNVQGLTALKELQCGGNQLTELNVQDCTVLQELICSSNQLTALNVQGLTALKELTCGNNQLTELNVQSLTALKELSCGSNQLNADAFKKLFNDLPVRADSDNANCILYTEQTGVTEGNHTDFTAPPDLAAAFNNAKTVKKWKMYKRNGSWPGVEI